MKRKTALRIPAEKIKLSLAIGFFFIWLLLMFLLLQAVLQFLGASKILFTLPKGIS